MIAARGGAMQRRRFTEAQRVEIWERLASGEPAPSVARAYGCFPNAIRQMQLLTGGAKPRTRTQRSGALSLAEREEISRGVVRHLSCRAIATRLGRAPSTISRELQRNSGVAMYRAHTAQRRAQRQARRPKPAKLTKCRRLREVVESKLALKWSPVQISRWLPIAFPSDGEMRVSHETIYMSLFVQGRGALRHELHRALRTGRALRRPKRSLRSGMGMLREMVMISERPPEVADRAVPGHWEGDLLMGTRDTAIATLVERQTRYCQLVALPEGTNAEPVCEALKASIITLPVQLRRSLTWDQGKEMAAHGRFSIETGVEIYFCDPRSPWQRGSNENTNGLLRQYFPKGKSLAGVSQAELDEVARKLNDRPRQTLGFRTPAEKLTELIDGVPHTDPSER